MSAYVFLVSYIGSSANTVAYGFYARALFMVLLGMQVVLAAVAGIYIERRKERGQKDEQEEDCLRQRVPHALPQTMPAPSRYQKQMKRRYQRRKAAGNTDQDGLDALELMQNNSLEKKLP